LGPAEQIFELTEHPLSHRMIEGLALAVDGELLADLGPGFPSEVEVDEIGVDTHHEAVHGLKGLHELRRHQAEGDADAVSQPGPRRRHGPQEEEKGERQQRRSAASQKVTDGWWTPKTRRSRSQISPRVLPASTASTISTRRLARPRAPLSSAS